jgi:transcription termination/antitermination protein NusA
MRSEFEVAFNEITELRSLPPEVVKEALETALISAYRRDTNASSAQRVEASIDSNSGRARIFVEKEVVDSVENPNTEVELEKARYYNPEANLGDMVMVQVQQTTKKFGRIAAQTAKQVILQKIREAERNSLYEEFVGREGDVVNGTVQSINASMVTLSLGRAEAILPRAQQIPGEKYKPHDKIRAYVVEVKRSNRGPQIIVSRSHRNMLRRLLEYEVPEIYNGQVEIKSIAREAGYRSKVAVAALQDGIDPVGACVGMRGMRIQNIVKELHEEKIDVIEWNQNQESFIAKALSPARVSGVYLEDDPLEGRTAVVIVPDDQLSLAIGREGQNARLAAKLTGWRIDIKSVSEAVQDALSKLNVGPLADLKTKQAEMVAEVQRIMEKKAANRTVMPEEYQVLGKFADLAEKRLLNARETARQARLAEINKLKATLPQAAFQMPIDTLGLPENVTEALQPLGNVGEIMWRFLIDEGSLQQLLQGLPNDTLTQLQLALDRIVIPDVYEAPVAQPEPEVEAAAPAPATAEAEPEPAVAEIMVEEEVVPDAFADIPVVETAPPPPPVLPPAKPDADIKIRKPAKKFEDEAEEFDDEEEDVDLMVTGAKGGRKDKEKKKKAKERQQRRQLIFDEEIGQIIAKRRRKGGRGGEWEDEE